MSNALSKKDPRDFSIGGLTMKSVGIEFSDNVSFDDWQSAGAFIQRVEGAAQWWIGDWLRYGEGRPEWGDKYEQAISMFDLSYSALTDYKWVAQAFEFSARAENLSWTHHRALASLPKEERQELLKEAAPEEPDRPPRMTVSEVKKEVKKRERERNTPPLPPKVYRVIYADPPWQYNDERTGTPESGGAIGQYDLMPTDCICMLHKDGRAVRDIAAKDSVLFMWATAPMLPDALRVIAAWGFQYKAQFVWDKVRTYNGHYNDVQHELLLVATRGSCVIESESLPKSVVRIERTNHSAKPAEFYELINEMYPCQNGAVDRIELFARKRREGWDAWGNQAGTDTTQT